MISSLKLLNTSSSFTPYIEAKSFLLNCTKDTAFCATYLSNAILAAIATFLLRLPSVFLNNILYGYLASPSMFAGFPFKCKFLSKFSNSLVSLLNTVYKSSSLAGLAARLEVGFPILTAFIKLNGVAFLALPLNV